MRPKKPTLDNYVQAILARDRGASYPEVLSSYEITPNQFHAAVFHRIGDFLPHVSPSIGQTLEAISSDSERRQELFNMGMEFVRIQYHNLRNGTQKRVHNGTYNHPENIDSLVYVALTFHNPQLASPDRARVVQAIKNLSSNLQVYFHEIGLNGLMTNAFEKGKQSSPLAVLEVFDRAYQRLRGDVSLFDLSQEHYLEFDRSNHLIR